MDGAAGPIRLLKAVVMEYQTPQSISPFTVVLIQFQTLAQKRTQNFFRIQARQIEIQQTYMTLISIQTIVL